ncbi:EF-hand domain-containing protein [Novosphingobium lubricantis]|jgi:hypothetical protein
MKTFKIAAAAAVMATAGVAMYAASPVMAQGMGAERGKPMTWADAKGMGDRMWERLDVNKDGKLDQADRTARMEQRFKSIDTDGNGAISRDEFMAHHAQMGDRKHGGARMAGGDDAMGDHGKGHKRGRWGKGGMAGGHMLAMADTNKDGAVSRAEFDAMAKAHFDKADANKDGTVTPEERRAMMKDMMGRMHGKRGPAGQPAPAAD